MTTAIERAAPKVSLRVVDLNDVDEAPVRAYLARRGMDAAYIDWKYFPPGDDVETNRGCVALLGDDIAGFIGLLPFRVMLHGAPVNTAWTCDWSVDPDAKNPVIGMALMKAAIAAHDHVFHLGGSVATHKIFARFASHFEAEAVREYVIRIRLSSLLERASERAPVLRLLNATPVGRLPLQPLKHGTGAPRLPVVPGLDPGFADAIQAQRTEAPIRPLYDHAYLTWLIEDCPTLTVRSCLSPGGAAGIMWHRTGNTTECRIAIAAPPEAEGELKDVIASLIRDARALGAEAVRIRAAEADVASRDLLSSLGFRPKRLLPYFAFQKAKDDRLNVTMSGLSYLDVDEAETGWVPGEE